MWSVDLMTNTPYGKAALKKLAPVAENFHIFEAGWLGDKPSEWDTMKVRGCVFREAKSGPNKGKLSIPVKGTTRTAYVNRKEMEEFNESRD